MDTTSSNDLDWSMYDPRDFLWAGSLDREEFTQRLHRLFPERKLIIPHDRPLRVYWGASLFTDPHRRRNRNGKLLLSALPVDVFLPQEDGGLVETMLERGIPEAQAKQMVFHMDVWGIYHCDLYVGARWNRRPDVGECWEHGYAFAHKKPCVTIEPNTRRSRRYAANPMLTQSLIREPFRTTGAFVKWLRREIA